MTSRGRKRAFMATSKRASATPGIKVPRSGRKPEAEGRVRRNIAMRPGIRRALDLSREIDRLHDQLETIKARIRAKVEHPFHIIKNRFGLKKVRYRGLAKNTAQLMTLFGLANLMIAKRRLLQFSAQGGS